MADSFPLLPILCFSCFQSEPSWLQGFTAEVMEVIMHGRFLSSSSHPLFLVLSVGA